jgi:hypothetical protein
MRTRLAHLLLWSNPRSLVLILSLFTLSWGWDIASDGIFGTNPIYRFLATVGNEMVFGCVALAIGGIQILALLINRVGLMRVTTILCVALWSGLAVGIWMGGASGTAVKLNSIIALSAVWAYLLLGVRQRNGE